MGSFNSENKLPGSGCLFIRVATPQLIRDTTKLEEIQLFILILKRKEQTQTNQPKKIKKKLKKIPYPGLLNTFCQHDNRVDILFPNHAPEVFYSIG